MEYYKSRYEVGIDEKWRTHVFKEVKKFSRMAQDVLDKDIGGVHRRMEKEGDVIVIKKFFVRVIEPTD